jgi:dolichyl-phosphate-mannose--protein O-mannosyl transferase
VEKYRNPLVVDGESICAYLDRIEICTNLYRYFIYFMINEIMSFLLCNYIVYITLQILKELIIERERGRCGRDRMVVGFTTTYAISAYHHWCCEFEPRSGRGVQHYVIKFVSGFLRVLRFPPPIKLTAKHHQTNKHPIL